MHNAYGANNTKFKYKIFLKAYLNVKKGPCRDDDLPRFLPVPVKAISRPSAVLIT